MCFLLSDPANGRDRPIEFYTYLKKHSLIFSLFFFFLHERNHDVRSFVFTMCTFHLIIWLQGFFVSGHRDLSTSCEHIIQCIFFFFSQNSWNSSQDIFNKKRSSAHVWSEGWKQDWSTRTLGGDKPGLYPWLPLCWLHTPHSPRVRRLSSQRPSPKEGSSGAQSWEATHWVCTFFLD